MADQVHLAVALERAGWHPAAWREPTARPRDLTRPSYWRAQLRTADDAGLVLATIEDALALADRAERDDALRRDRVRGRLDAVLLASYAAPLTRRIGLVPAVTTTHPEPFHLATSLQTLDHSSLGRAGVRIVAGSSPAERRNFGRRADGPDGQPAAGDDDTTEWIAAFREAGEVADAIGRLWDSWQDDAIIRDIATGRFLDADRVHAIDFEGEFFSITGASIVPRSPQGRPVVTALAHRSVAYRFTAQHADVVFVTPPDAAAVGGILAELDAAAVSPRDRAPLRVFADLLVLVEETRAAAASALARLDDLDGSPLASDARVVAGTADDVVDEVRALAAAGVDGVRLRPARQPADLVAIAERVAPRLRAARALRDDDDATLRARLGLPRPESRYAREKVAP